MAGCIGSPGAMISSPVERMATTGFRQTSTAATPIAASTPVSRLVSSWPRRSTVSPPVMSVPANDTPLPGVTALAIRSSRPLDLRVLDHDHGVGAARNHPAGGNRHGRARPNHRRRHDARVNRFLAELHGARHFLGRAERVFGDDGEAIHVRAVERRHVHGRDDVGGQHAAERGVERHRFDAARRQVDRGAKAPLRLVAIEHVEKLLLVTHRARPRRRCRARTPRCRRAR